MKLQLMTLVVFLSLLRQRRQLPVVVHQIKVSKQDQHGAQQIARAFVKKMQEKRDVSLLLDTMFLPDFTSHFVSDDDTVPRSVYSGLTTQERQRLLVAQTNAAYLATLDALSRPKENTSEGDRYRQAFNSILPPLIADKLRTVVWPNNEFKFSSYDELRKRLPEIEKALADAGNYLIANSLEQSNAFQKELGDTITGTGTKYACGLILEVMEFRIANRLLDLREAKSFSAWKPLCKWAWS